MGNKPAHAADPNSDINDHFGEMSVDTICSFW